MRSSEDVRDAAWAFERYEEVRNALPRAGFPARHECVSGLAALTGRIDTFLLDAFGVLNVGEAPISGAIERMAALRASGKRLVVVSNSASFPTPVTAAKYRRLGFDFTDDEVVTSRDALKAGLRAYPPIRWGVAAMRSSELDELQIDTIPLEDDPAAYCEAQGFILLSAGEWTEARQTLLVEALRDRPRPVFVGNPDIVAPRESGLSLEPGFYAQSLAVQTECEPVYFGKPFGNIFSLASARIGGLDPRRTAMVGDTLHTDVLGGAAAGLQTVLVTSHGLFANVDTGPYIARSGIVPRFVSHTV